MVRPSSSRLLFTAIGSCEPKMFGVKYGFVQETGNVMVVKGVSGVTPTPLTSHQAERSKHSELMRNGGLF
jgi:hypothetical protein